MGNVTTPNGIEICYETFGEAANGPPVLLISGAGLQMLSWPDGFCEMLSDRGLRVIRFDNRDTGKSSNLSHLKAPAPWRVALLHKLGIREPPPYALEDMAADVVHLLDGLKAERAHLVGISLGGMLAQIVAIHHGERVASLTCIASTARNSRHSMPRIGTVFEMMRRPSPGRDGYVEWNLALVRAVGGPAAEGPDDYLRDNAGRMYDRGINQAGMYRHVSAVYASRDRRPALSEVTAPTLVIHGAEDPLVHPQAGREIADAVPAATFRLVEGMGHGILRPVWSRLVKLIVAHVKPGTSSSSV